MGQQHPNQTRVITKNVKPIYPNKHMKNATPKTILELLVKVELCDDTEKIDFDASLLNQGLDSIDFLRLYLAVEEEYGIKIPDEDMPSLGSVKQIVTYVNSNI
jgi:acyl carrier protein